MANEMNPTSRDYMTSVVNAYFDAQHRADPDAVVALFHPNGRIHNVDMTPAYGTDAIRRFCADLYARTNQRYFDVVALAHAEGIAMAEWEGMFAYPAGATVSGHILARPFTATVRGVHRFSFTADGFVHDLRMFHETTTLARLARQHSQTPTQFRL
jgi:SnoaL-like domain